jgi:hypothetical protein
VEEPALLAKSALGTTRDGVRPGGPGQVSASGCATLARGTEAKGTSYVPLSGGAPLGPDGARRLADALREAQPSLLTALDLRYSHVTRARALAKRHACSRAHRHTPSSMPD